MSNKIVSLLSHRGSSALKEAILLVMGNEEFSVRQNCTVISEQKDAGKPPPLIHTHVSTGHHSSGCAVQMLHYYEATFLETVMSQPM